MILLRVFLRGHFSSRSHDDDDFGGNLPLLLLLLHLFLLLRSSPAHYSAAVESPGYFTAATATSSVVPRDTDEDGPLVAHLSRPLLPPRLTPDRARRSARYGRPTPVATAKLALLAVDPTSPAGWYRLALPAWTRERVRERRKRDPRKKRETRRVKKGGRESDRAAHSPSLS